MKRLSLLFVVLGIIIVFGYASGEKYNDDANLVTMK